MYRMNKAFLLVCISLLMLGWGLDVYAQNWLTLHPLQIEALIHFDGTDRRNREAEDSRDTEFGAGLALRQSGYALDPSIASFSLELEPSRAWGNFTTESQVQDRDDEILSYFVQLDLLNNEAEPFGFGLSAVKSNNLNTGSLGSRSEIDLATQSFLMRWRYRPFPMDFSFENRDRREDFLSGISNVRSLRDENLQTWLLRGRSSKLKVQLEHSSLDDKVPERDRDFDQDRFNLVHRLPWGHGSELRSNWDYRDRSGFNGYRRINLEEAATIRHTPVLHSVSTYRFSAVRQVVSTDEHLADLSVTHNLYGNLRTTAQLLGRNLTSDTRDENVWRTGIRSGYKKSDFFGIPVHAAAGYFYQQTDRVSHGGLLEVLEESHTVPLAGSVILDSLYVLVETVIVENAAGDQSFTEGVDYLLVRLSGDLTEVQVISGGRISEDETILVTYKAELSPSQEFSSTQTSYSFGFNLGWVYFSHAYSNLDEKLLSGFGENFLRDVLTENTSLNFNWKMGRTDARFTAQRYYYSLRDFESLSYTYRQQLSRQLSPTTYASLNLTRSETEDTIRDTDVYNLEVAVDWQPLGRLSVRATLGAWKNTRVDRTDERIMQEDEFVSASLSLRWWYRKVSLDLVYSHNQRTTDQHQTVDDRLMFNLRRRF